MLASMPLVVRASQVSSTVQYIFSTPVRWARLASVRVQSVGRSWCIELPLQKGEALPLQPPPRQIVTAGRNSPGVALLSQHVHLYSKVGLHFLYPSRQIRVSGTLASQQLLWEQGIYTTPCTTVTPRHNNFRTDQPHSGPIFERRRQVGLEPLERLFAWITDQGDQPPTEDQKMLPWCTAKVPLERGQHDSYFGIGHTVRVNRPPHV